MTARPTVDRIRDEFDVKAPTYETDRLSRWYQQQDALTVERLDLFPGATVLDVGCGTGWLLRRSAHSWPGVRGVGVDLSDGMVAEAERIAGLERLDGLTFVAADWESVELGTMLRRAGIDGFDRAVCVSTFHYFTDPLAAVAKILRALSPGGRFLLLDRAKDGSALTRFWEMLHRRVLRSELRFYSTDGLRTVLQHAGFDDIREVATLRRYLWKGKLYTSLVLLSASRPGGAGSESESVTADATRAP